MARSTRSTRDIQTDIDRITIMLKDARDTGNIDTEDILIQAEARFENELEKLTRDSRATRVASIDSASAELVAFENESNVSPALKAAIALSRGDLTNRRKNA